MKGQLKKSLRYFICLALIICMGSVGASANEKNLSRSKRGYASIKWYGHSCFDITNKNGTKIITDPFVDGIGYDVPNFYADIVTISHDHFDHNNLQAVKGNFYAIRERGAFKPNSIKINGIKTFHDTEEGALRGENTIYTYNVDGVKICHLGDLGHLLSKDNIEKIGKVDVLLIPVGGLYTIDAETAVQVVKQLNPKVVIPMHFKTDNLVPEFGDLDKVESFTNKMTGWQIDTMEKFEFNKTEISKIKNKIILLKYN